MFELPPFLSVNNPVMITIIILCFLGVVIFIIYKYFYLPLQKKQQKTKNNYIKLNREISEILLDKDPNPVLRLSSSGEIIRLNEAAKFVINKKGDIKRDMLDKISRSEYTVKDIIHKDIEIKEIISFNGQTFDVEIKGFGKINALQIYMHDITENYENEKKLNEYRQKVQLLTKQIEISIEKEKDRISKELHDSICQELLLIKLNLKSVKENNGKISQEMINHIEQTIDLSRNLAYRLKPFELDDVNLIDFIYDLCERITAPANIEYEFIHNKDIPDLSYDLIINLIRIIQEVLNNILKYSNAEKFVIDLLCKNEKVNLLISDNGKGFIVDTLSDGRYNSKGMGLINIQERVKNFGGNLDIDSSPGNGVTIIIEIPILGHKND